MPRALGKGPAVPHKHRGRGLGLDRVSRKMQEGDYQTGKGVRVRWSTVGREGLAEDVAGATLGQDSTGSSRSFHLPLPQCSLWGPAGPQNSCHGAW